MLHFSVCKHLRCPFLFNSFENICTKLYIFAIYLLLHTLKTCREPAGQHIVFNSSCFNNGFIIISNSQHITFVHIYGANLTLLLLPNYLLLRLPQTCPFTHVFSCYSHRPLLSPTVSPTLPFIPHNKHSPSSALRCTLIIVRCTIYPQGD